LSDSFKDSQLKIKLNLLLLRCYRERRKEMDGTIVALKQKLGHTGSKPEVAVNLERRVGIEEIGIDATVGIFFCQGIAWQQVQHVVDNRQDMYCSIRLFEVSVSPFLP
jgi:hypothetical protein